MKLPSFQRSFALVRMFIFTGYLSILAAGLVASANDLTSNHDAITVSLSEGVREDVDLDERGRLRLKRGDENHASAGTLMSEVIDCGPGGSVSVEWIEQWTAPQRWQKHSSNPIFGPRQTGDWDNWTNGVSIVRSGDGKSYKMFFSGRVGSGIGFAEAAIEDPLHWKENPASPVLKPRSDNWEGNILNQPRVVRVSDDHWRMYYTGWGAPQPEGGGPWAFGLAESFDGGVSWKRVQEEPLIERGAADSPDGGGVFVPEVRRVEGTWMMWYTAMKIVKDRQNIQLCLATSDDGVHWTKYAQNPVLSDEFETGPTRNVTSRCFVRHADGVFQMWYSHAKPDYRIKYAESLDGIAWEKSPIQPVLDAGAAGQWDDQMVEYPEIDVVNGEWRMWFCGNGFGSVGFAEGVPETSVRLELRSGNTLSPSTRLSPDASWSQWQPVERRQRLDRGRYVQVRVGLESSNPRLSPAVSGVRLRIGR